MMSAEALASADEVIIDWFRTARGEAVVALERQTRWRPVWFVTVKNPGAGNGQPREFVVRGDRTDMPLIFPLRHEMAFQAVLHDHDIPVPEVLGWIDQLPAYVMERVRGQEHFPNTSDADRAAAVDDYLSILARIHALPIAPFVEAGIHRADDPMDAGTTGLARYEKHYRSLKVGPDPLLEFFLGWLKRNPLDTKGREAPIVWDSGQFHHEDGRIVAVLDLELGHIGDPMMDLAAWRMRDTIVGYGDMAHLYSRYEEHSGKPVDLRAIRWHHLAFTLSNQLAFSHALRDPSPSSDLMTNLQWCGETNLFATEALGAQLGVSLPTVDMPTAQTSAATAGHMQMVRALRTIRVDDRFAQHELRTLFRLARHLQRRDEIGDELAAADLDDLEALLGVRPTTGAEGEAALEQFVINDAGRHDEELVRLFHARNLRAHMLLGPADSAMTHHHTIQPF